MPQSSYYCVPEPALAEHFVERSEPLAQPLAITKTRA